MPQRVQVLKTDSCPFTQVGSNDQVVSELDDEYEITATVVDTEQLNWWLRGFGDAVSGVQKTPLKN